MSSRLVLLLAALLLVPLAFVTACGSVHGEGDGRDFVPEILPLPADPGDYAPLDGYEAMQIPEDNPITAEKAALGRQLFFDERLSGDGQLSCYSCHLVEKGLTDGRRVAVGAYGKVLKRASPTLWNIGYHQFWYWDGRASTLEAQALAAWKGGNMGAKDTAPILELIESRPGYVDQFRDVFGGPATEDNVSQALATYMRTLVSTDTALDRYLEGDDEALTASQQRGYEVFKEIGCSECHAGRLVTDLQFHNVGIGLDMDDPDIGRYTVTGREQDRGAFKTPTLRDVSKRAPYFHNGVADTLEEAVQLMLQGGLPTLWMTSPKLKPVDLTEQDFRSLIDFLLALDQPMIDALRPPRLP